MKEFEKGSLAVIQLFKGKPGHLVPRFDYDSISENLFQLVGNMILHSLWNNCRGLTGLSPAMISCVFSGSRDTVLEAIMIEDIFDPCLRESLTKVSYLYVC